MVGECKLSPWRWLTALAWAGIAFGADVALRPDLKRIAPNASGITAAILVPDQPLVFTRQISAPAPATAAGASARDALAALETVLRSAGSDLDHVVRLNGYAADAAGVAAIRTAVASRWGTAPIALTVVRTPVPSDGAAVAFDAVATSDAEGRQVRTLDRSAAAIMPAGGKVFISGQAERADDLGESVRRTMAGLERSLRHIGLSMADVVQVKAFLRPLADHAVAEREVRASFRDRPAPPLVMLEWVSPLFVEIELVAALPPAATAPQATTFARLPWLNASPRYSHVCVVPAGTPLIFLSAIDGGNADARTQMKAIFERLGSTLFDAGSGFRHIAKATYYLANGPARTLLGDIRDVYFDPARAATASALEMAALPKAGSVGMIDVIAVPNSAP